MIIMSAGFLRNCAGCLFPSIWRVCSSAASCRLKTCTFPCCSTAAIWASSRSPCAALAWRNVPAAWCISTRTFWPWCEPNSALYSVLEKLQRQVLYFDTDTVIFTQKDRECKLPMDEFWGNLKCKTDCELITAFMSRGTKNNVYR